MGVFSTKGRKLTKNPTASKDVPGAFIDNGPPTPPHRGPGAPPQALPGAADGLPPQFTTPQPLMHPAASFPAVSQPIQGRRRPQSYHPGNAMQQYQPYSSAKPTFLSRTIERQRMAANDPNVPGIPPNTLPPNTLPPNTIPPNTIPPNTIPPNPIPPNPIPPNPIPAPPQYGQNNVGKPPNARMFRPQVPENRPPQAWSPDTALVPTPPPLQPATYDVNTNTIQRNAAEINSHQQPAMYDVNTNTTQRNEPEMHFRQHSMPADLGRSESSRIHRKPVPRKPTQPDISSYTAVVELPTTLEPSHPLPIRPTSMITPPTQKRSSRSGSVPFLPDPQSFNNESAQLKQTEVQWSANTLHERKFSPENSIPIEFQHSNPVVPAPKPQIPDVAAQELESSAVPSSVNGAPMGRAEWDKKCLRYFKAKYLERLNVERWQNEPLRELFGVPATPKEARYQLPIKAVEEDIEMMPNLLNDRLFYLALLVVQSCGRQYSCFLWEMFGTNPGCLLRICTALLSANRPPKWKPDSDPLVLLEACLGFAINGNKGSKSNHSFDSLYADIADALRTTKAVSSPFFMELSYMKSRLAELKEEHHKYELDSTWKGSWEAPHTGKDSDPSGERALGSSCFPLYNGLQQYLAEGKDRLLGVILEDAISKTPNLPPPPPNTDVSLISQPRPPSQEGLPSILFDAPGAGKSRIIQDALRQHEGFYFLAPNLPPSDVDSVTSLLTADRTGASQDTYSIYTDLSKLAVTGLRVRVFPFASDEKDENSLWQQCLLLSQDSIAQPLIAARLSLLKRFLPKRPRGAKLLDAQTKWARIQSTCTAHNDLFDIAHRFFRLQDPSHWEMSTGETFHLYFVDESQCAMGDPLAEDILFAILSQAKGSRLISGTSLKLEQMNHFLQVRFPSQDEDSALRVSLYHNYIQDENSFYQALHRYSWDVIIEVYKLQKIKYSQYASAPNHFPLLARGGKPLDFPVNLPQGGWQNIEPVAKNCALLQKYRNEHISAEHTAFLGRVRWTTIFAEELLRSACDKSWLLSPGDIVEASQRAQWKIKDSLKRQIDSIKHSSWVDDLFWTAINVDVFSKARLFDSKDSAQLISEGFALVHEVPNSIHSPVVFGHLREPLVVEAVMEYLRESEENLYERLMNRFFANMQFDSDQGGIGKYAESIFTSKLDHFLRAESQNDEVAKHRRKEFNKVIAKANCYNGATLKWETMDSIQLGDYFLDRTDIRADLFDGQMPIQDWVELEDRGEQRPTFLFPRSEEGPDLVFLLKHKNTPEKILCMMQYKTELTGDQPTQMLEAVESLSRPWGSDLGNGITWNKGPVIHMVVASTVAIRDQTLQSLFDLAPNLHLGADEMPQLRQTLCANFCVGNQHPHDPSQDTSDRWICFLDQQDSDQVLGLSFQRLLELMKKK